MCLEHARKLVLNGVRQLDKQMGFDSDSGNPDPSDYLPDCLDFSDFQS